MNPGFEGLKIRIARKDGGREGVKYKILDRFHMFHQESTSFSQQKVIRDDFKSVIY